MPKAFPLENDSEEQRKDRNHVLAAVKQDGRGLQYAAPELRGNKEIVLAATTKLGRCFKWASNELKSDREFVLQVMKQDANSGWWAFEYASDDVRGDAEVALAAISQNGMAMTKCMPKLLRDGQFLFEAVKACKTMEYVPDEWRGNHEWYVNAVEKIQPNVKWALGYPGVKGSPADGGRKSVYEGTQLPC